MFHASKAVIFSSAVKLCPLSIHPATKMGLPGHFSDAGCTLGMCHHYGSASLWLHTTPQDQHQCVLVHILGINLGLRMGPNYQNKKRPAPPIPTINLEQLSHITVVPPQWGIRVRDVICVPSCLEPMFEWFHPPNYPQCTPRCPRFKD